MAYLDAYTTLVVLLRARANNPSNLDAFDEEF